MFFFLYFSSIFNETVISSVQNKVLLLLPVTVLTRTAAGLENNRVKSVMGHSSDNDAVARALASHQCGSSSIPGLGVIRGLSLLLVLVLAPRSRGFSPGTPVFPSPQKPTLLNSNSIWKVSPISALR